MGKITAEMLAAAPLAAVPEANVIEANSLEHVEFGEDSFDVLLKENPDIFALLASNKFYNREKRTFKLPNGAELTYGQIVALAGDFFGLPDEPICDGSTPEMREDRFARAYASMAEDPGALVKIENVLKTFDVHKDRIHTAIARGQSIPGYYEANGATETVEFSRAMASKKVPFYDVIGRLRKKFPNVGSPYTNLLKTNYDHFSPFAKAAYLAGHALAIKYARQAANPKLYEEEKKCRLLVRAITMEAFANHYSTDAFAGGHVRVPRKLLPQYAVEHHGCSAPEKVALEKFTDVSTLGDVLVHEMHEEDGDHGVWVKSHDNPDGWVAYGDGMFAEHVNAYNKEQLLKAVRAGLLDVVDAFKGHEQPRTYTAIRKNKSGEQREVQLESADYHWPKAMKKPPAGAHCAMFRVVDGKVEKRQDLKDRNCSTYVPHGEWKARAALKERGVNPESTGIKFALGH